MRNLMVRTNRFTRSTAKLAVIVLLAALLSVVPFHAALAETAPDLGAASTFAVLGGPAVTLTASAVAGDVGSGLPGSAVTLTGSTVTGTVHKGDTVAQHAYADFLSAYNALKDEPCTGSLETAYTGATLTLTPGVYCNPADVTFTDTTLTLDADGDPNPVWIFKIGTGGTGALTGTGFSVVMANGGVPCNVYWWTAEAATLTDSSFQGTILAGAAITVTRGTFINGRALATAAVTLTGAIVSGCGSSGPPNPPPTYGSIIKVTGGGQISVTGGQATFGFNAQPDKKGGAKGNFNYVNHVTGLHINGNVNSIVVIVKDAGTPKTVQFSGTYEGGSFIVTVQDNDEPGGGSDQFGVTLIGSQSEVESMRVISRGNIQFHNK